MTEVTNKHEKNCKINKKSSCIAIRGVNGLYIYSTVIVERCWFFYSMPTVFQRYVNALEIIMKTNIIFLKLMNF